VSATEPQNAAELERELARLLAACDRLRTAVGAIVLGQRAAFELVLQAVLAGGHVLLEGAPGIGKTTLAKCLARGLGLGYQRVQCTPDLMPADVLGMRVLEQAESGAHRLRFERGPIFTHVLLADEINRATPRTQSALLEAMAEHQVTLFGETIALEQPFLVLATQNPIEMEGTYPLPEAQLDRFAVKVRIEAPAESDLVAILEAPAAGNASALAPCLTRADVLALRRACARIPASRELLRLVARATIATDPARAESPEEVRSCVRLGASPRGAQALLALARARALLRGALHVAEEDVLACAAPALRHRIALNYEGEARGFDADALVALALERARRASERR